MKSNKYTIVTGASSGIGFECSKYLAKLDKNLILVARNKKKLLEMKRNLEKIYDINCIVVILDLTLKESNSKLISILKKERISIDCAIINAGFGDHQNFQESLLTTQLEMIQLNVTSLVDLTHQLIPLIKKSKGHIMHVASIAAYQPLPSMAVYGATKSFVLSFSQALREELIGEINVSTLCPGPTITNFSNRARMQDTKAFNDKNTLMSAKDVAKIGIDQMYENKAIIVPGITNKLSTSFAKILPTTLTSKFAKSVLKK